jgi:DNA-binding CsgD family transcriptional regulator
MRLLEREHELATLEAVLMEGGVVIVEGGAGIGKTSLLAAAAERAAELGHEVLRARGSELEAGFAFGVVRQLFERRLALVPGDERRALLAGPASAAEQVLIGKPGEGAVTDTWFAVLHGLYWLAANIAAVRPLLIAVDDAHSADVPSLRCLAYLAPRVEGLALSLLVALRPSRPAEEPPPLAAIRAEASVVRPRLLSEAGAADLVRSAAGSEVSVEACAALWQASGGNPFYLIELLRGAKSSGSPVEIVRDGVTRHVAARIHRLDPDALRLAQAIAVLGDGCQLHHAAALAGLEFETGARLAAALVDLEVLGADTPPRFLHPIVRDSVEASLAGDERDITHRAAARLLYGDGAPPGRVGAHLLTVQSSADPWVVARLREAAANAVESGSPQAAAALLGRALAEPPPAAERVALLRELSRAEELAGQDAALAHLAEARDLIQDRRQRAEIGLQIARAQADLFHWVEAVDVSESTLAELGDQDRDLQAKLEAQVVVAGLRVARRVSLAPPALKRLAGHQHSSSGTADYLLAQGMVGFWIEGWPAADVRAPLEEVFARPGPVTENWDTRGPATWALVFAEGYDAAQAVLESMRAEVERSGSARGLFTTFMTLGLLSVRLGALPEADAAARIGLRVLEGLGFDRGLRLLASVLIDIGIEAGQLDEAESVLDLLRRTELPAELSTVIAVAACARLRLAQGRPAEALADFEKVRALYSPETWGLEMHDNGFLHARSGAALALLQLGVREQAHELAGQELTDARAFGAPRALGIALRVAGLTHGDDEGIALLEESVAVLRDSPAQLERGHSLCELGAALRRSGHRAAAREPLSEALDLAARCGARTLAARAREELKAAGARPRSEWRTGVEALTPSELRVARLAAEGRTNREIAQALYVTLKTVEGHLARVFDKLRITGRAELAQGLGGEKTGVPTL